MNSDLNHEIDATLSIVLKVLRDQYGRSYRLDDIELDMVRFWCAACFTTMRSFAALTAEEAVRPYIDEAMDLLVETKNLAGDIKQAQQDQSKVIDDLRKDIERISAIAQTAMRAANSATAAINSMSMHTTEFAKKYPSLKVSTDTPNERGRA
jgi:hypothetical protein